MNDLKVIKKLNNSIVHCYSEGLGREVLAFGKGIGFNIERIFVGTIVGPFFEEFLFRIVFFTTIAYILGFIDNKFGYKLSKKIFNLRGMLCWILIIIGNSLFSLAHVPDANNFHLYFIGGVIDTIIYIKYGFYASWLSHWFYNYFRFAFIFSWFGVN